jgi:hypothetical protein
MILTAGAANNERGKSAGTKSSPGHVRHAAKDRIVGIGGKPRDVLMLEDRELRNCFAAANTQFRRMDEAAS